MMRRQSGRLSMVVMDLSERIPDDHLLRRISRVISFDFIYEILEPYYPPNGRPSILSVCLKCCWLDIYMGSNQNVDLYRKSN